MYLAADPAHIVAVDLNPNHVALSQLKLTALERLPSYEQFFRFFGRADDKANRALFDQVLSRHLDGVTRAYWDETRAFRGRRIDMFTDDLYRHGLLGRFIGVLHGGEIARQAARRHRDGEEQRGAARRIRSLHRAAVRSRSIRLLSKSPISLYALGIPPAQYDELVAEGDPISVLRARVEKLACDFPVGENYFAWQAFTRGYDVEKRQAVPRPICSATIYDIIRTRTDRVEITAGLDDRLPGNP